MFDKKLKQEVGNLKQSIEIAEGNFLAKSRSDEELIKKLQDKISDLSSANQNYSMELEEIKSSFGSFLEGLSTRFDGFIKSHEGDLKELKKDIAVVNNKIDNEKQEIENKIKNIDKTLLAQEQTNKKESGDIRLSIEGLKSNLGNIDSKQKLYIDSKIDGVGVETQKLFETIKTLSSTSSKDINALNEKIARTDGKFDNIQTKVDLLLKDSLRDIANIKERLIIFENLKPQIDNRMALWEKEILSLKEIKDRMNSLGNISKDIEERFSIFNNVLQVSIDNALNKKFVEYQRWINHEYYEVAEKLINIFVGKMKGEEAELKNIQSKMLSQALEEKWSKERKIKGHEIVNKGEAVILKHEQLKKEIVELEKSGANVDALREQLKAYDSIMEMLK